MEKQIRKALENLAQSNLVLNPQNLNCRSLQVGMDGEVCIIGPSYGSVLIYELELISKSKIPITKINSGIQWGKWSGEPVTEIELANKNKYRLHPTGVAFPEQPSYQSFCIGDYFTGVNK